MVPSCHRTRSSHVLGILEHHCCSPTPLFGIVDSNLLSPNGSSCFSSDIMLSIFQGFPNASRFQSIKAQMRHHARAQPDPPSPKTVGMHSNGTAKAKRVQGHLQKQPEKFPSRKCESLFRCSSVPVFHGPPHVLTLPMKNNLSENKTPHYARQPYKESPSPPQ